MTARAWWSLEADVAELVDILSRPETGPRAAAEASARLGRVRAILADGTIDDRADRAVIGRRVAVREADGARPTFALVIPGDGDPAFGWISADCPVGAALLGARAGEFVTVHAPAGPRALLVERVE